MTRYTTSEFFTGILLLLSISSVQAYFPLNAAKREVLRRQFSSSGVFDSGLTSTGGVNLTGVTGVEGYVRPQAGTVVGAHLVSSSIGAADCNTNFLVGTITDITNPPTPFCYCTPSSSNLALNGSTSSSAGSSAGVGNTTSATGGGNAGAGVGVGTGNSGSGNSTTSGTSPAINNGTACPSCITGFVPACDSGNCECFCAPGSTQNSDGTCSIIPARRSTSSISTSTTTDSSTTTTSTSIASSIFNIPPIATNRKLVTTTSPPLEHLQTTIPSTSSSSPTALIGTAVPRITSMPSTTSNTPVITPSITLISSGNRIVEVSFVILLFDLSLCLIL